MAASHIPWAGKAPSSAPAASEAPFCLCAAAAAVAECAVCAAFLCTTCLVSHSRNKFTIDHPTVALTTAPAIALVGAGQNQARPPTHSSSFAAAAVVMCPAHPTQPLLFFCQTDMELLCAECAPRHTTSGLHHTVIAIKDPALFAVSEGAVVPAAAQLAAVLGAAVARVRGEADAVRAQETTLRVEVEAHRGRAILACTAETSAINARCDSLFCHLETLCGAKLKRLKVQGDALAIAQVYSLLDVFIIPPILIY
jgi:hypothetical protein